MVGMAVVVGAVVVGVVMGGGTEVVMVVVVVAAAAAAAAAAAVSAVVGGEADVVLAGGLGLGAPCTRVTQSLQKICPQELGILNRGIPLYSFTIGHIAAISRLT
jgi:hypothetical protein